MRRGDWLQRFITADDGRTIGEFALAGYFLLIIGALLSLLILPRLPQEDAGSPVGQAEDGTTSLLAEIRSATLGGDAGSSEGIELAFDDSADENAAAADSQPKRERDTARASATERLAQQAAGRDAERQGFIPLEFSLPPGSGDAATLDTDPVGGIQIRKAVRQGDASLGSIRITVDRNSRLFAEASEVRRLLAGRQIPSGVPETGLVSFRMLRDLGVDLRYSPTQDIVTLRGN